jgi:hypothetical protein
MQDSPLLSRIRTGFGRELDQMIWLPSRTGYLKLHLGDSDMPLWMSSKGTYSCVS